MARKWKNDSDMFEVDMQDDGDTSDEPLMDADAAMEAIEEDLVERTSMSLLNDDHPVRLTMQLIRESVSCANPLSLLSVAKYNGSTLRGNDLDDDDDDQQINTLLQRRCLRLDWLNIGKIENLEAFTHVQELYLQHNLIDRIENLDDHQELTFLALGGNRIRKVEGLKHLTNLKFLDLSNNCIEDFQISEFPKSLMILRLAGNPFVRHMPAYVHLFFERLPNLVQVDQFRRSSSGDSSGAIAPVCISPRSQFIELEMEAEFHEQSVKETLQPNGADEDDENASEAFDMAVYEEIRKERIGKWKQQLKDLELRKAELEKDAPITLSTPRLKSKRLTALTRARETTDVAIADSVTRFQQMELEHKEWQETHQQQLSPAS